MTPCIGKTCVGKDGNPRLAQHGLLCGACTRRLEQQLAEMPARLDLLAAMLGGHHTPRRQDRPGGEAPLPLNVTAHDLLQEIPAVLGSWVQLVCEERSLRGPDTHDRVPAWLLSQLPWLVSQPWVDDLADELDGLVSRAEGVLATRPHRHRLEPPCPSCGASELGRWDGTAQVDCASCGRAWAESEYPWMVRLALAESGGCLTAAEAAARLEVTYGRVRNLVAEGAIRKLGTVDGRAYYSAADVEALREDGAA